MEFIRQIEHLDQNISLWINSLNTPLTDSIWTFFSDRLIWIPLYLWVLVLIIVRLGVKKGLIAVLFLVLAILCADQFCNLVKNAVCRLRPCNDPSIVKRGLHMLAGASQRHPYGFFSAHAANAMAFAVGGGMILRKVIWKVSLDIWAALVGISRIFVGKHYLGDVAVGFIVGAVVALILLTICRLILFKTRTAESAGTPQGA